MMDRHDSGHGALHGETTNVENRFKSRLREWPSHLIN